MNTEPHEIRVGGIPVEIVRKGIKNLHLGVYPPEGRVRVAAPLAVSDDAVRLAVIGKLGWIKRRQASFARQPRESAPEMVSGESHYYLGRRYRLRVLVGEGPARVVLRNRTTMELHVRADAGAEARERALSRWYRERLRALMPPILARWERILRVEAARFGIKRMKTKWGSCSTAARRIWINLELAKKPAACLEYVVVHELTHLVARKHDEKFFALMDRHLPRWRQHRAALNGTPLGHERWRK